MSSNSSLWYRVKTAARECRPPALGELLRSGPSLADFDGNEQRIRTQSENSTRRAGEGEVYREAWGSRLMFLAAAIGSAIGLGNIWRFPFVTYDSGGGVFLVPYVFALFSVGMPLLLLELALGQQMQSGAVNALAKINTRLWGIGFASAATSLVVVTYYNVIMAWATIFLFSSFQDPLPWAGGGSAAEDFFFNEVLNTSGGLGAMGAVQWKPCLALIFNWLLVLLCVFKGVKSTGKAALITMPLPFVILLILFFRSVSLSGAGTGLEFLFKPDMARLVDPRIWLSAVSQIFFSLSLAGGIMIAYASFIPKQQHIVRDTAVIALANSFCSVFAAMTVFGALGHMARERGVPVDEVVEQGIALVFVAFPEVLAVMPAPQFFSVLFFLMLLFLGLDSAFSLVEAFNTIIYDRFPVMAERKELVSGCVCLAGFLFGLSMTTRGGIYLLDLFDHYLADYILVVIGLAEVIIIGWVYGTERLAAEVKLNTGYDVPKIWHPLIKYFNPVALFSLLMYNFVHEALHGYAGYPGWALAIGWIIVIITIGVMIFGFLRPLSDRRIPRPVSVEMGSFQGPMG